MTNSRRNTDPELDDGELRAAVQLRLLPALPDDRLNALHSRYNPKFVVEHARPELLGERAWRALRSRAFVGRSERALAAVEKLGITIITIRDDGYPKQLRPLGAAAPPVLFCRGRTELFQRRGIAVIGARDSTEYGDSVAELLSVELAHRGITVISGLARGIDGIAHAAALAAGGSTIAVLGCGVDVSYPPSNARLQERIAEEGLLISEFAPGTGAFRRNFPLRNRLIALLGSGVLVVEAGVKSGTRNTVGWALEYNREVFAVPGPIGREESQGTNEIIQDGGHLVMSIRDVMEVLHWQDEPRLQAVAHDDLLPGAAAATRAVFQVVQTTALHVDEIARRSGLSMTAALAELMQLELAGFVIQQPGKRFTRVLTR